MDERQLRLLLIFRAVAEAGGLTAAEARLRMERSTISRHLQALEQRLGGTLCARGPSGFALTALGQAALQAAIDAADSLEALRDRLDQARDAVEGELRLGLAESCVGNPECRLPLAIGAFRLQAPAARLSVVSGPDDALRRDIAQRRVHIIIAELRPEAAPPEAVPLFSEERRLYVRAADAEDGPPTAEALAEHGYAMAAREGDLRAAALARRLGLVARATVRGLPALAMVLESGGYVAHLPPHAVPPRRDRSALVEVPGAAPFAYRATFGMLSLPSPAVPRVATLFTGLLRQAHGL